MLDRLSIGLAMPAVIVILGLVPPCSWRVRSNADFFNSFACRLLQGGKVGDEGTVWLNHKYILSRGLCIMLLGFPERTSAVPIHLSFLPYRVRAGAT